MKKPKKKVLSLSLIIKDSIVNQKFTLTDYLEIFFTPNWNEFTCSYKGKTLSE